MPLFCIPRRVDCDRANLEVERRGFRPYPRVCRMFPSCLAVARENRFKLGSYEYTSVRQSGARTWHWARR